MSYFQGGLQCIWADFSGCSSFLMKWINFWRIHWKKRNKSQTCIRNLKPVYFQTILPWMEITWDRHFSNTAPQNLQINWSGKHLLLRIYVIHYLNILHTTFCNSWMMCCYIVKSQSFVFHPALFASVMTQPDHLRRCLVWRM